MKQKTIPLKKLTVWVSEALLLLVSIFLLYVTVTGVMYKNDPSTVPMPLGFNMLTVLTGSMQPYLQQGDKVIVTKTEPSELEVGDIITFNHDGLIITHRIVEIYGKNNPFSFQTKGDFNNAIDSFIVEENQIIGKIQMRLIPINFLIHLVK